MCDTSPQSLKMFYEMAATELTLSDQQQLLDDLERLSENPLEFINDDSTADDVMLELFPANEDYTRLFDEVSVPLPINTANVPSQQSANSICYEQPQPIAPSSNNERANTVHARIPLSMPLLTPVPEVPVAIANPVQVNQTSANVTKNVAPLFQPPDEPENFLRPSPNTSSAVDYVPAKKIAIKNEWHEEVLHSLRCTVVVRRLAANHPAVLKLKRKPNSNFLSAYKIPKKSSSKTAPQKSDTALCRPKLEQKHFEATSQKLETLSSQNRVSKCHQRSESARVGSDSIRAHAAVKIEQKHSTATKPRSKDSAKTNQSKDAIENVPVSVDASTIRKTRALEQPDLARKKVKKDDHYAPELRMCSHAAVKIEQKPRSKDSAKTNQSKDAIENVPVSVGANTVRKTRAFEQPDLVRKKVKEDDHYASVLNANFSNLSFEQSDSMCNKVEGDDHYAPVLKKYLTDAIVKFDCESMLTKESKLCILEEKDILRLMKQAIFECLSSKSFTNFNDCQLRKLEPNKRVRFDESPKVHYIEQRNSDERERNSVFVKSYKVSGKKYEQVVENMMKKVLKWNPRWLEKHRQLHLKDDDLPNEKENSIAKYRKHLKDTAVQELWKMMYNAYQATTNESLLSYDVDSTDRSGDSLWKIRIKRKLSSYEEGSNIVEGDLTILNVYIKGRYEVASWLKRNVFGYVLQSETVGKRDVLAYENIMLEVHSMGDVELKIGKDCATVQRITSMNRSLKMFQMLCLSKMSPLTKLIVGSEEKTLDVQQQSSATSISSKDEQKEATNMCLSTIHSNRPSLRLIEGAPGTGKTQVMINFVKELFSTSRDQRPYSKILIITPTELAADNLSFRLLSAVGNNFTLLRYGDAEKIDPTLNKVTLEQLMKDNENEVKDDDMELESKLIMAKRNACMSNNGTVRLEKKEKHDDISIARKKTRILREMVLDKTDVVIVTKQTCLSSNFEEDFMYSVKNEGYYHKFTLCIIDNAERLTGVDMLIPISIVTNLILVGDSSQNLISKGVTGSPFNQIFNAYANQGDTNKIVKLKQQYRMHPKILDCLNSTYGHQLNFQNDDKTSKFPLKPLVVVDFKNSGMIDHDELINKYAVFAKNVVQSIRKLKKSKEIQIGIIVERKKQREAMEDHLANNEIAIEKLYDFSGIEKDVIILCVPFLQYPEMYFYIGMSRAKHSLIICGDFAKIKGVDSTDCLLNFAKRRKSLQSWEKDPKDFPFDLLTYRF